MLLKQGDWGHSYFYSYSDPDNELNIDNVAVSGAACICFDRDRNIILTKNKAGGYDLLGGKCEPGENYVDTLKREALEEAGVGLNKWQYFGFYKIITSDNAPEEYNDKYPKESYFLFFIALGEVVSEPYGKEIEGYRVFSVDDMKNDKVLDHEMLWEAIEIVEQGSISFL